MDLDDPIDVKYRFLSIGDALVDEFLSLPTSEQFIDAKQKLFCFPYGQKVEMGGVAYCVGGNAANSAVGMSRLGIKTALLSAIGDDWTAKMILDIMASEGIGTFGIERVKGFPGGRGVVVNYASERTILSFHPALPYKVPTISPDIEWIFLTSMGAGYESTYKAVVKWKKESATQGKLAYNPGTVQLNDGISAWQEVIKVADVLLVNREEAERICGFNSESDIKTIQQKMLTFGPKTVVITDGPQGAYVNNAVLNIGTGFLAALINGKEIKEAMKWGMVNAASVAMKVGAQAGLLTRQAIESWSKKAVSVTPEAVR